MSRPTSIHINLERLCENFRCARRLHGGSLLAVVKANAYGHGAVACARALAPQAEGFAVAILEEGVELRAAGITQPIVLLEGIFSAADLGQVRDQALTAVLHQPWQVQLLSELEVPPAGGFWLKFDSGMHRLGMNEPELRWAVDRLRRRFPGVTVTVMTHFAHADGVSPGVLDPALTLFRQAIHGLSVRTSLANSGAILGYPEARSDWGRPGLMLYGLDPASPGQPVRAGLRPVMSLRSRIMAERWIEKGESVGYGGLFQARRPVRIGVIPCGYADGYPRTAPQGTWVGAGEDLVPLAGRVSMDMLTVDLTDAPRVTVGTEVELWGDQVPVSTLAHCCGTLAYELVCRVQRAARHTDD